MFAEQVGAMLSEAGVAYATHLLTSREEQDEALARFRAPGFPFVGVDGQLVGGFPEVVQAHADGRLLELIQARAADRSGPGRAVLPRRSSSITMGAVRESLGAGVATGARAGENEAHPQHGPPERAEPSGASGAAAHGDVLDGLRWEPAAPVASASNAGGAGAQSAGSPRLSRRPSAPLPGDPDKKK
jgi:hypothetical protein